MDASQKIDFYAARLGDPNLGLGTKVSAAMAVRGLLQTFCSPEPTFQKFLSRLWPVFRNILRGDPDFFPTLLQQKLRKQVLEILQMLHHTSPLIEHLAVEMVDLLMGLVRVDNEDNAVLCLKTIMKLEIYQPQATASRVQPFLDLIREMLGMLEKVVRDTFDIPPTAANSSTTDMGNEVLRSPRSGSPATTVSDPGREQRKIPPLVKGMHSFKVLSECPIIVASIFQAHRNSILTNVEEFVPSIEAILLLQAKAQEKAHADAAEQKQIFTGVSKDIKNRAAFGDFITVQVKTMSFLAYLLQVYADQLSELLPAVPGVVVRLLKDCPREKSRTRKELLVTIQRIISLNGCEMFLNKIDQLLDERILIGDGLTVNETMRPLAYGMLAGLIHHVRDSLSRDQIRKTIQVYIRNLHDNLPGTSFQSMSANLLLDMITSTTKLEDQEDARHFSIMILDAIGDKFAAMNYQYSNAVKLSKQYSDKSKEGQLEVYLDYKDYVPDWDEVDIFNATPIKTSDPRDRGADPMADNKYLFKTLVNGLKKVFYQLKNCNPSEVNFDQANLLPSWPKFSYGYNAEEVRVVTKLFHQGARVFRYYSTDPLQTEARYPSSFGTMASHSMTTISQEEKELLESFGTVFRCLDPATFHEVFQSEIPHLHDLMLEHTALLYLPQFFLASGTTSPAFAGMALQYLVNQLPEVGSSDVKKSLILLRMFKLSFLAVKLLPQHNEQVLHPHITEIVTRCVQLSASAEKPIHYFILLRSLFRSCRDGRFKLLRKQILPLLEMLLTTFNHLLQRARSTHDRDLYVELGLTVPAGLSHLLPHLSHLMRLSVVALRAGPDLFDQGLRMLESCVDNLEADYLKPIVAPVMDDLLRALTKHLDPQDSRCIRSQIIMRKLMKLGAYNWDSFDHIQQPSPGGDDEPSLDLPLGDMNESRVSELQTEVDVAITRLSWSTRPGDPHVDAKEKRRSFELISNRVKLLKNFEQLPGEFGADLRLQTTNILVQRFETYADRRASKEHDGLMHFDTDMQATLKKLLKACMEATTISELKTDAETFMSEVARHFTIVELGETMYDFGRTSEELDVHLRERAFDLYTKTFVEVLADGFTSANIAMWKTASNLLFTVKDCAAIILGSVEKAATLPFFSHITQTFCYACTKADWFIKAAAALGLQTIVSELGLGQAFLLNNHLDIMEALLVVVEDSPQDVSTSTRKTLQDTLELMLRKVCDGSGTDTISNEKSYIHLLLVKLSVELSHSNKQVREVAQYLFSAMAEKLEVEVHDIIAPIKERILQPILHRPLSEVPFHLQAGSIDAVTYCVGLGPDLVQLDAQCKRLVMEALALVDADDTVVYARANEDTVVGYAVSLRVSCLRLLSVAIGLPGFVAEFENTTRARMITVFIKLLYSESQEVAEAARTSLGKVLAQAGGLTEDLLQYGLEPILTRLEESQRLSIADLDGLMRVLSWPWNYIDVNLGLRLLEYMQNISFGPINQSPQIEVVTAIINSFHLLPLTTSTFIDQLISAVLDSELKLRRTCSSPFREPLILYLNKYPRETSKFFYERLQEETYGRFYAQLLGEASAEPLRDALIEMTEAFAGTIFANESDDLNVVALINGLQIVQATCQSDKSAKWLRDQKSFLKNLWEAGKRLEDQLREGELPPGQRLRARQAGHALVDVLLSYLSAFPDDIDFMMEVFSEAAQGHINPSLSLTKFLYREIVQSESPTLQRTILERCLDIYNEQGVSQKMKAFLLHNVVNPIFAKDLQRSRQGKPDTPAVADKPIFDFIHKQVWKHPAAKLDGDSGQIGIDHTRMEALQLSTFIIKYHGDAVAKARNDIIKFAWRCLRLEDVITRHAAYVLICHIIRLSGASTETLMQIYSRLLKAHQDEGRSLTTQAFGILAPVLYVAESPTHDPCDDKRPSFWARQACKILNEDVGNTRQVQAILKLVVRQPDLFYESSKTLVDAVIRSLPEIAYPADQSHSGRTFALSLVDLICQWEYRRATDEAACQSPELSETRDSTGVQLSTSDTSKTWPERLVTPVWQAKVVQYVVAFIASSPERHPILVAKPKFRTAEKGQQTTISNNMCERAASLLYQLLSPQVWADVDVSLCERILGPILSGDKAEKPDEKHLTSMMNALQAMWILMDAKSNDWIFSHKDIIEGLLKKARMVVKLERVVSTFDETLHTTSSL